jgi:hypothetical protein
LDHQVYIYRRQIAWREMHIWMKNKKNSIIGGCMGRIVIFPFGLSKFSLLKFGVVSCVGILPGDDTLFLGLGTSNLNLTCKSKIAYIWFDGWMDGWPALLLW